MRTDALLDLFALHQWETDGGPAFDDADATSATIVEEDSVKFSTATVAPSQNGCPIHRDPQHINTRDSIMTQHVATEAKDILIHAFHTDAECEYSGKSGEAVEISTSDGTIQHAVICMAELTKLLRFRHRQHEKQNGNGKVAE